MRGITKGKRGEDEYSLTIEECQSAIDWCALKLNKHKRISKSDPYSRVHIDDVRKAISHLASAAVLLTSATSS